MKRASAIVLVCVAVIVSAAPVDAYLKLGTRLRDGRTVTLRWNQMPVRYFVTDRGTTGVTAAQFQTAVNRAFDAWVSVDTATVSAQFVGFTGASPGPDGATTLGFVNRPDLDRVVAATSFVADAITGDVLESDIFFNSFLPWSASASGEPNRFDVESIAVHEVGHLLGLAHSALGETELRAGGRTVLGSEAIMFPLAFAAGTTLGRQLKADDIAGISDIYPTGAFERRTGSVSGRILKNGRGVIGAHVTAFNTRTGRLVASFSLNAAGEYTVAGLEPGPHILRIEPLDDGDIESFFEASLGIDLDFRPKFHSQIVIVPEGGGTRGVDITVVPK